MLKGEGGSCLWAAVPPVVLLWGRRKRDDGGEAQEEREHSQDVETGSLLCFSLQDQYHWANQVQYLFIYLFIVVVWFSDTGFFFSFLKYF